MQHFIDLRVLPEGEAHSVLLPGPSDFLIHVHLPERGIVNALVIPYRWTFPERHSVEVEGLKAELSSAEIDLLGEAAEAVLKRISSGLEQNFEGGNRLDPSQLTLRAIAGIRAAEKALSVADEQLRFAFRMAHRDVGPLTGLPEAAALLSTEALESHVEYLLEEAQSWAADRAAAAAAS